MESIRLGTSDLQSSRLVYGCMRLVGDGGPAGRERGMQAIGAALDAGFDQFDHADIYGGGACEELFGRFLSENPGVRDEILITGKCGIRFRGEPHPDSPKRYDFSAAHIVASVDGSLARLGTDRLDLLLLHRPDFLMRAEEVAGAFEELAGAGKVRQFGVSNFRPSQVELLQAWTDFPLLVNQVEINIHNIDSLNDGTLDQCQLLRITPQAWSPLAGVVSTPWGNTFTDDDFSRIRTEIDRQARRYGTQDWLVMLAWLLRHPAGISPIVGSTSPDRIRAAVGALQLDYLAEDWYRLLEARNGTEVP